MWRNNASRPVVALVGLYQVGKSTLVNCLVGRIVSRMGRGMSTSHCVTRYSHGVPLARVWFASGTMSELPLVRFEAGEIPDYDRAEVVLPASILESVYLLDTPGVFAPGEAGALDQHRSEATHAESDLFLVVVPNRQLSQPILNYLLDKLPDRPFVVVMNCCDGDISPVSNQNSRTADAIQSQLSMVGLTPVTMPGASPVWAVNAAWDLVARVPSAPGDRNADDTGSVTTAGSLELLKDQVEDYYHRRQKALPDSETLQVLARVDSLRRFLSGPASVIGNVYDASALWRDFRACMGEIRQVASPLTAASQ